MNWFYELKKNKHILIIRIRRILKGCPPVMSPTNFKFLQDQKVTLLRKPKTEERMRNYQVRERTGDYANVCWFKEVGIFSLKKRRLRRHMTTVFKCLQAFDPW